MRKHNASKVVLITILVFLLLSWILPAAYYSGEYADQGRVQMGLLDLFNYPLTSLSYFGYMAIFLILVGGFYGILYKIPAYRTFLDRIVKLVNGSEKIVLAFMVALLAILVSICGVQLAILLFVPFLVSLILLMGYDKMVAGIVTIGSISVGLIGSTFGGSNLGVLTSALQLDYDYQLLPRFILLFLGIALVIFNVFMYIKKENQVVKVQKKEEKAEEKKEEKKILEEKVSVNVTSTKPAKTSNKKSGKKSSSKSRKSDNKAALKEEDVIVVKETVMRENYFVPVEANGKGKIWPFILMFSLMFVLMIMAFIPWESFGIETFANITNNFEKYSLYGFPLFSKVFGSFSPFGNWTVADLFFPLALVVLFLSVIYRLRFDEVCDGFVTGVKKALGPAFIVILLYTVLVLVTYHPFQLTIYKTILSWTKGFNIATTALVGILSGLFNSDIAYSFQSVVPYYSSIVTKSSHYGLAAIIFQSMYGLTMFVAPTSLSLMTILSYLDIPYKNWLKANWKLLLELLIALLIVFIVLAL